MRCEVVPWCLVHAGGMPEASLWLSVWGTRRLCSAERRQHLRHLWTKSACSHPSASSIVSMRLVSCTSSSCSDALLCRSRGGGSAWTRRTDVSYSRWRCSAWRRRWEASGPAPSATARPPRTCRSAGPGARGRRAKAPPAPNTGKTGQATPSRRPTVSRAVLANMPDMTDRVHGVDDADRPSKMLGRELPYHRAGGV